MPVPIVPAPRIEIVLMSSIFFSMGGYILVAALSEKINTFVQLTQRYQLIFEIPVFKFHTLTKRGCVVFSIPTIANGAGKPLFS